MEQVIAWALIGIMAAWIAWEFFRSGKRSYTMAVFNAVVVATIVFFISNSQIDWVTATPIAIWWILAVLSGALLAYAVWPRSAAKLQ